MISVIEIAPDGTIESGEYPPTCEVCDGKLTNLHGMKVVEIRKASGPDYSEDVESCKEGENTPFASVSPPESIPAIVATPILSPSPMQSPRKPSTPLRSPRDRDRASKWRPAILDT